MSLTHADGLGLPHTRKFSSVCSRCVLVAIVVLVSATTDFFVNSRDGGDYIGSLFASTPWSSTSLSATLHEKAISGVSGTRWTAKDKLRTFSKARFFQNERHDESEGRPVIDGAAIDAWFNSQGPEKDAVAAAATATRKLDDTQKASSSCRSDKWVVITSIFGPTKLVYQLESLAGWCTVVVADHKTPLEEWEGTNFKRVKLLTMEEQSALPLKVLKFLPTNHFGRKNIGYLYAFKAGAKYIYDTDDDNVLKEGSDGTPRDIPIVNAKKSGHFVAQAWPCRFDEDEIRSWNPYPIYGQTTAWPRGLPLDDIVPTSKPCGHAAAVAESNDPNINHLPYTYHKVFHRLPGVTFPIQQSLADTHPDVDAIYRLTRFSPTFVFDTADNTAEGVYGPDNVYAPYNAQATLHQESAFWALLLPVTVHGRVSDIWRAYIAQRLMWKYGMRVAFMKPWVNQERTAHDFLQDFSSEEQLYLRAGGLIDFLREWKPSREDLTLPAEQEELMVALYERGVIEEKDVLLTQAWLQDLRALGYKFPDTGMKFYEAWTNQRFLGGLAILTDEHQNGTDLRSILPLVDQQLAMFTNTTTAYPTMIFHIDTEEKDGWMNEAMKKDLRQLAPNLRLEFYGTQYTWPQGEGYEQDGYVFCSQFLSYEVYRHPALRRLEYLLRLDEDITSFTQQNEVVTLDFFESMSSNALDVVGLQRAKEYDFVTNHMCSRAKLFFKDEMEKEGEEKDSSLDWVEGLNRVERTFCSTLDMQGGYIELYNLKNIFFTPSYFRYLESIDFLQGIYKFMWREQSYKTIWLFGASTNETYRDMRAELPLLRHHGQEW